jgi:hypothetical protein
MQSGTRSGGAGAVRPGSANNNREGTGVSGRSAHAPLVALAGALAIPAKLSPNPDRTRVAVGGGQSVFSEPPPSPPLVTPPPPPPPFERPIQAPDDSAVAPERTGASAAPAPFEASTFRDRTPVARAPASDASRHVFALIIGINDYPGTTADLRGAVPDAEDMSDVLAMYGVPDENVRTLLDGDAGTTAINDGLQWLDTVTQTDSTAVLFYAGHVRKLDDHTEAVIAADGGVLPDWYLASQLQDLPAHNFWIVMAACYGGGFTELMAPGRMLTAAADADSLAYENESFDRSYLDEYLVHQALLQRLAARPTAQDAFTYAQAALQRDYPNRMLTQLDQTTQAISLDGVPRDAPPTGTSSNTSSGGGPLTPPSGSPQAPQPPPPCQNLLGLLCPPGTR